MGDSLPAQVDERSCLLPTVTRFSIAECALILQFFTPTGPSLETDDALMTFRRKDVARGVLTLSPRLKSMITHLTPTGRFAKTTSPLSLTGERRYARSLLSRFFADAFREPRQPKSNRKRFRRPGRRFGDRGNSVRGAASRRTPL